MKFIILFLLIFIIFTGFSKMFSPQLEAQENPSFDLALVIDNSGSMKTLSKETIINFVEEIGENNRIGIIFFGEDARLMYPMKQISIGEEKRNAKNTLSKLNFREKFTNINEGLKIALSELTIRGRENMSKIVVLISDGKIDPPPGKVTRDILLRELLEKILPVYLHNKIIIHSIAYGDSDLHLMQVISSRTNGKCFVVPNTLTLKDALSVIVERIQSFAKPSEEKPATIEEAEKRPSGIIPSNLILVSGIFAAVLLILAGTVFILIIVTHKRLKYFIKPSSFPRTKAKEILPFSMLFESLSQIKQLMGEANSNLENFRLDLEDYGVESWEREKGLETRYHTILNNLFLLLDHLEKPVKDEKKLDEISWLYKKINLILEDEGIEKIPVKEGDHFNGKYHKFEGERPDEHSRGTILEVVRKGYYKKGKTEEEDIIMRPSGVIISSGLSEKSPN